jgi:hypothetical protein
VYTIDELDQVHKLEGFPQIYPGAPSPVVLADEHSVSLSYWLNFPTEAEKAQAKPSEYDPAAPDVFAVILFRNSLCHMFGYPNEEAYSGHPLAACGYHAFGVFEVKNSSWIRQLEVMNRVHEHHSAELFDKDRHLIFGFHDTTLEVVCGDYEVHLVKDDEQRRNCLTEMVRLLA